MNFTCAPNNILERWSALNILSYSLSFCIKIASTVTSLITLWNKATPFLYAHCLLSLLLFFLLSCSVLNVLYNTVLKRKHYCSVTGLSFSMYVWNTAVVFWFFILQYTSVHAINFILYQQYNNKIDPALFLIFLILETTYSFNAAWIRLLWVAPM